jgi:excisionase family DNA binding protein
MPFPAWHTEHVVMILRAKEHTMEKQKLGYSLKEAAEVSSLSRRTLEWLIEQGKLKAVKVNTRTVIPASALEKLMEIGTGTGIRVQD